MERSLMMKSTKVRSISISCKQMLSRCNNSRNSNSNWLALMLLKVKSNLVIRLRIGPRVRLKVRLLLLIKRLELIKMTYLKNFYVLSVLRIEKR